MDDIKRPKPGRTTAPLLVQRPVFARQIHRPTPVRQAPKPIAQAAPFAAPEPQNTPRKRTLSIKFRAPKLPKMPRMNIPMSPKIHRFLWFLNDLRIRGTLVGMVGLVIFVEVLTLMQPLLAQRSYALGAADSLLGETSQSMTKYLQHDKKQQMFNFNQGYTPNSSPDTITKGGPKVTATAHESASGGISVTDPVHKTDFTLTPKFNLKDGKQDGNRIVYPFADGTGWLIYSMHGIGIKEDVVLAASQTDAAEFNYDLGLGDGLEAHMMKNGDIGIYGNTLLTSQVSAGNDSDAALLQKAREKAAKDTLMFTIPAPVIIEKGNKKSSVKGVFELNGTSLKVKVNGLSKASYPLTIDPSIYVETAEEFMRGNNETNIDFNVADTLIQKGSTTGARFDQWDTATALPNANWNGGTVAAGGYIYSAGGTQFNGQIFSSSGTDTYVVPAGVTTITVKAWGGAGGGGAGNNTVGGNGGDGGGGGFTQADITVTPGETLDIAVGSGGAKGGNNSNGGDAGGYSAVQRSSTFLVQAGGGGGGGGGRGTGYGGTGGGGGGATGGSADPAGGTATVGGGGGPGSATAGTAGAVGTGGVAGSTGAANLGGDAGGSGASCTTSVAGIRGGAGGTGGGGEGGSAGTCVGGGGGGSGRFGGGGGGSAGTASANRGAGGGGGGSSLVTGTNTTQTVAAGDTPGNSTDSYRGQAAVGGVGGVTPATSSDGGSGLVAVLVTGSSAVVSSTVNWAKFNTSTGAIVSPDPGTGACAGWCTKAAYNLPQARAGFSLVAYSGFLYAMGGVNTAGTRQNTVYIAKLGANGEPQLWHPTDSNKNNWVYWYTDTNLSSIRANSSAVAYNNRMYLLGGIGATVPVNTVEIANINPTGTLGTWASSAATLPSNRYGHNAQVYNDRLYLIGGASTVGGAPVATVNYNKINTDGTLNSWVATSGFGTARMTGGGNFSATWGAYIYLSGGCSAVNGSGYCTSIESQGQVASINADGSLDVWNNMAGVSRQSMGHGLVAWRSMVYEVGGCSSQSSTTGECGSTLGTSASGKINQDGDASTVGVSDTVGTGNCSGAAPFNCDMPSTANVGTMLNATAIINGFLYIIGGCTNFSCSTTSDRMIYAAIDSDGTLTKPSATSCPGATYSGSWCLDSTHLVTGGIGAPGVAVFGGRIYMVGGLDGGGNTDQLYYSSVNANGVPSNWTIQSMNTVGMTNEVSYTFAYARANPSSAGTNPGNLYLFGGCATSSSAGCTAYSQSVYKCNIQTSGAVAGCTTTGQLQIGIVPGDSAAGLGIHAGTVYANYIYLIGGVSPNQTDLRTIRYAKFDNNNNVVAASGTTWTQSASLMDIGRRRGAAFGYNGYLYVVGGYDGTSGGGVLADIEFAKINVSTGDFGTFVVSAVEINQRWGLSVPISNSYAYVIGGCDSGASPGGCTNFHEQVQTFQIYNNDSGSPDAYTAGTNTGVTNIGGSATVLNGRIYYAGGCVTNLNCSTPTNTTYYASINSNGVVGSWSAGGALPGNRGWGNLTSAGGTLYYIGGQTGTATTTAQTSVYYTTSITGGSPTWGTTTALTGARTQLGVASWNNRIYVVGGYSSAGTVQNTVYVSPQLPTGGTISGWTSLTGFNVARAGATAIAYANNLYVLGGMDGTNYLSDTQYTQINTDGTLDAWTYSSSLPFGIANADGFAANGYMYLIGGRTATTTCRPVSLVAPISANTTIASGNNPTGVGEWYETNQRYTGDRYGAAAVYYDGKAYVLGGGCSAYVATGNWQYYTTLLSQPQVAKYSIMIDADTDVFPKKWLLNGLDNSIGAAWQLKYRSMTNTTTSCTSPAMTTWGTETNVGDVTLGTPGTYTPLNGSSVNTNCARFFYMAVTIDSSQTYGYPDDVTRGPTITDLTLLFTADPSKRLMHGRTFINGVQQPLDTPF